MNPDLNRRDFLKNSAAGAAVGAQLVSTLAAPASARAEKANDRLRIGFIGTGRRGFGTHVKSLVALREEGANIDLVGVCDVYSVHRDQAVEYIKTKTGVQPKSFADYRDLLAEKDVDAVCIATPDQLARPPDPRCARRRKARLL